MTEFSSCKSPSREGAKEFIRHFATAPFPKGANYDDAKYDVPPFEKGGPGGDFELMLAGASAH